MIKIGDQVRLEKKITDELVKSFADVSGDYNLIHLDDEYAKTSIFKKRIAHGMITASLISNLIGNKLPGEGTIYMDQTLKFNAPVYIEDEVSVIVTILDIDFNKGNITLETLCKNKDGNIVVSGVARVKNKKALGIL